MPRKQAHRSQAHRPANDDAGQHAPFGRPAWQGHLRLSLVSCPVTLVSAITRADDISFHLINPATKNRIRMVATDPDAGPVNRADLAKGYEISKDEYVLLTPEDFDEVKLETTRTLDIERFVDADTIDRLYWDEPYFLLPDGKDMQAYSVIHQSMVQANRLALGRVVMHTRERLVAIEPRGKGLIAYTLRMANEVRDPGEAFAGITATKADRKMTEIALQIIAQLDGPFEPAKFVDRYEAALRRLIRDRMKGRSPVRAPEPEDTNVIDLMDALKKSLGRKPERHAASAKKPRKRA